MDKYFEMTSPDLRLSAGYFLLKTKFIHDYFCDNVMISDSISFASLWHLDHAVS